MKKILLSLTLIILQTTPALAETNLILRPTADGAISQWSVTPASPHYAAIDDSGDATDYISLAGVGRNGNEKDEFFVSIPSTSSTVKTVTLWIYGKNEGCRGKGNHNCDTLNFIVDNQFSVKDVSLPVNSFGWISISYNVSSYNYNLPEMVMFSMTRKANGSGDNNDGIKVASLYIDVVTDL